MCVCVCVCGMCVYLSFCIMCCKPCTYNYIRTYVMEINTAYTMCVYMCIILGEVLCGCEEHNGNLILNEVRKYLHVIFMGLL